MARLFCSLLLLSAVVLAGGACLAGTEPPTYRAGSVPRGELGAPAPTYGHAAWKPAPTDPSPHLQLAAWHRPGVSLSGSLAAFSPDGRLLATGNSREGSVCLWEVDAGSPRVLLRADDPVDALAFSPDGRRLAAATRSGGARLWDVRSGREVAALPGARAPLAFSPDGALLATGDASDAALLWDGRSGTLAARLRAEGGPACALSFSADGGLLASAHPSRPPTDTRSSDWLPESVCLWDGRTGEPRATVGDAGAPLAFAPDSSGLWTGAGCISLESGAFGRLDPVVPWAGASPGHTFAFGPGGEHVVFRGIGAWPLVAGVSTGKVHGALQGKLHVGRRQVLLAALIAAVLLMSIPLLAGRIGRRCVGRHPAIVVSAGLGGCLLGPFIGIGVALAVWWPFSGVQAERSLCPIVFSPDGRYLATGDATGKLRLWRAGDCRKEAEVHTGQSDLKQVLFSPDGDLLLATDAGANVYFWRVQR